MGLSNPFKMNSFRGCVTKNDEPMRKMADTESLIKEDETGQAL